MLGNLYNTWIDGAATPELFCFTCLFSWYKDKENDNRLVGLSKRQYNKSEKKAG